ncbi:MAG: hypothetical protein WCT04_21895 [Planctomycetota bacterium]
MKLQASSRFNKEKLLFLGVTALLAICVYHFMSSRPVKLEISIPVSPLPIPGPLAPEKPDTRKGDIAFYLESGMRENILVNRDRNDPFAPFYIPSDLPPPNPNSKIVNGKPGTGAPLPPPPAPPPPPEVAKKDPNDDADKFNPSDKKAKVDFSAVVSMNGIVYGLLKDKEGKTIQVKVGDYLEDFKYTVSKIEKQAIWVLDENDRAFVARDLSFAADGKGSGGESADDKAPKKNDKAGKGGGKGPPPGGPGGGGAGAKTTAAGKTDSTASALADAAKQLAKLTQSMNDSRQNNIIQGDQGRQRRPGR